jgi:hypothetical protein
MTLSYDGRNNSLFSLHLLRMDDTAPTTAENAALDSLQNGVFHLPEFGTGYDTMVMVSAHITSDGGSQYSYSMESLAGTPSSDPSSQHEGPILLFENRPDPFRSHTTVRFILAEESHVRLRVYDVNGRLVRTLADGDAPAGYLQEATWDGRDSEGSPVSSGIYYIRLESDLDVATEKVVIAR